MTTNRVRPQWDLKPNGQRAGEDHSAEWTALAVTRESLRVMSDDDLAMEVARLHDEFIANNGLAIDEQWSHYSNLVFAELRTREE